MLKKTVSFNPYAFMIFTNSRKDYAEIEIQESWYSKDEYRNIQRDCCKQVRRMEWEQEQKQEQEQEQEGGCFDDTQDRGCCRGLESQTQVGRQRKTQNRNAAYGVVLNITAAAAALEKDSRSSSAALVAERISQEYMNVSSTCLLQAINIGHLDHIVAVQHPLA